MKKYQKIEKLPTFRFELYISLFVSIITFIFIFYDYMVYQKINYGIVILFIFFSVSSLLFYVETKTLKYKLEEEEIKRNYQNNKAILEKLVNYYLNLEETQQNYINKTSKKALILNIPFSSILQSENKALRDFFYYSNYKYLVEILEKDLELYA